MNAIKVRLVAINTMGDYSVFRDVGAVTTLMMKV